MMQQDLRYVFRTLARQKGFVCVVVGMLALAIGANTALFSFADALLFRPLPFAEPERLVTVKQGIGTLLDAGFESSEKFMARKQPVQSFEYLAAYDSGRANLTDEHAPERAQVMRVSADFFPLLGVNPRMGRWFRAEEQRAGENRVALLTHEIWQQRYGGDPGILRQTIRLNGVSFQIVGVMPAGFQFSQGKSRTDLWIPLTPKDDVLVKEVYFWEVLGRLQPGVSIARAQAELDLINRQLKLEVRKFGEFTHDPRALVVPLNEAFTGELREPLLILLAAVGFVLLIACANVGNLLLTRSIARGKEAALRAALGASRARLVRLWLTESMLLALAGGALGLLIASWLIEALVLISPLQLASIHPITLHWRVLAFCFVVTLLAGAIFGLIPAWQASRPDLVSSLKESGQRTAVSLTPRLRQVFTIGEIALALVLLLGAGLMVRSFLAVMELKSGFNPEGALTFELSPTVLKYKTPEQRAIYYQAVMARLRAIPGVAVVGSASHIPLVPDGGLSGWPVKPEGAVEAGEGLIGLNQVISGDFFRALDIPMIAGRTFNEQDRLGAPNVIVLNQTLSRKLFGSENSVGRRVVLTRGQPQSYEIIGVVADVKSLALEAEPLPEFYLHALQQPAAFVSIAIRTAGAPGSLLGAVRRAVADVDPDQPVHNLKTMEQHLADAVARRRFPMVMLAAFALAALLLSTMGLYSVVSCIVAQRTHEIGIRMALGACARDILRLMLGQGMRLAAAGILLGLVGAFAMTRWIAGQLYGVKPVDPLTFLAAAILLIAVALLACWLPARRATRIDPMTALREE